MSIDKEGVLIDKTLNNLDNFTLDFVSVLEKHTPYVLVSGYVAILFGRSRISEDIDLFIPRLEKVDFEKLYADLKTSFWCLNAESIDELYDMLLTKHSIRFAKKDKVIPNMEVKFIKSKIDQETFTNRIKVRMGKNILYVSPIELQILYKETILTSKKDLEDALHLRKTFADQLSQEKFKYYAKLLKENE